MSFLLNGLVVHIHLRIQRLDVAAHTCGWPSNTYKSVLFLCGVGTWSKQRSC